MSGQLLQQKQMLKAMSDYMASEKAISFDYDDGLEVVTKDDQKLALLSSGSVRSASRVPADSPTSS